MECDVLIIGGGLAGAWAAVASASSGASVVIAEKGYCGASGVAATGGVGHWWIPPDKKAREVAVEKQSARALGLGDATWMQHVLETTWATLPKLSPYYRFSTDAAGAPYYRGLRGPEYLQGLRRWNLDLGVRVLDQSPALELLMHPDGAIAGARGIRRQSGEPWEVRCPCVILATGGCAFASGLLGAGNNTGDGYLMAAEVGAALSGMEFSNHYGICPARTNHVRGGIWECATFWDAAGQPIEVPDSESLSNLARSLAEGVVYATVNRMSERLRSAMWHIQPAVMETFKRMKIDPFVDRFEVTLCGEGTIRGTGGIEVKDKSCQTAVPGLFAVGDAATREYVAGAVSGGGNQNAAWAVSSGAWAGAAAASRARGESRSRARDGVTGATTRWMAGPARKDTAAEMEEAIRAVQDEMLPAMKNMSRNADALAASLARLDSAWAHACSNFPRKRTEWPRAREAVALVQAARWSCLAALGRTESRGMHQRADTPRMEAALQRRQWVRGVQQPTAGFSTHGHGEVSND